MIAASRTTGHLKKVCMGNQQTVTIVVTNRTTGERCAARSHPNDDFNNNGKIELYAVPVYFVDIIGSAGSNANKIRTWKALRFLPHSNDRRGLFSTYKLKDSTNAGKTFVPRRKVQSYNPSFRVHNRSAIFDGAIQIESSFLLHAGPNNLADEAAGGAGCIEVIGNFNEFKKDIISLDGQHGNVDTAIASLVKEGRLYIQVDYAMPPDIKKHFLAEVKKAN